MLYMAVSPSPGFSRALCILNCDSLSVRAGFMTGKFTDEHSTAKNGMERRDSSAMPFVFT